MLACQPLPVGGAPPWAEAQEGRCSRPPHPTLDSTGEHERGEAAGPRRWEPWLCPPCPVTQVLPHLLPSLRPRSLKPPQQLGSRPSSPGRGLPSCGVCGCVHMYVCVYMCVGSRVCARMSCVHVHMCVSMCMHVCVYMCVLGDVHSRSSEGPRSGGCEEGGAA